MISASIARRGLLASAAVAFTLVLASAGLAGGGSGSPDANFGGGDGYSTADFGSDDVGRAVLVAPNDKIVVVGESFGATTEDDFAVVRFRRNGAIDTTFSGNGWVTTDFFGGDDGALEGRVLPNGKILVVGWAQAAGGSDDWHFALARYRENGTLDGSFGGDGKVTTPFPLEAYAYDIVVRGDGSFVVVGEQYYNDMTPANEDVDNFALAGYHANGTLDTDFGNNGRRITDFEGGQDGAWKARLQDGRILVAGWGEESLGAQDDVALARYTRNGNLDNTFGGDGKRLVDLTPTASDYANGLVVLPNGTFAVAPNYFDGTDWELAVAKFRKNGALDTDFGGGDGVGVLQVDGNQFGEELVLIDGRFYVPGQDSAGTPRFAAARFGPGGAPTMAFGGGDGLATLQIGTQAFARGGAAQDGKLLVSGFANIGGDNDVAVARFLP